MDWIETTKKLLEDEEMKAKFENSTDYIFAFQNWAAETYPEYFGND